MLLRIIKAKKVFTQKGVFSQKAIIQNMLVDACRNPGLFLYVSNLIMRQSYLIQSGGGTSHISYLL